MLLEYDEIAGDFISDVYLRYLNSFLTIQKWSDTGAMRFFFITTVYL